MRSTEPKFVEASDLGLPPFCWPPSINWDGKVWAKHHPIYDRERELLYFVYKNGDEFLKVAND